MIKKIHASLNSDGSLLGAILIITISLSIIGLSLVTLVMSDFKITTKNVSDVNALLVAEAGIEQSLHQLNSSTGFTGYSTAQEFFNNTTQGRGVFQTTVATAANSAKTITSTGSIYTLSSPSKLLSKRKIKVTVVGTGSDGYSVFSGPGGLVLSGSANITNSSVFVNGTIAMSGAAKIGTDSQPVSVDVANQACPTGASPGATYPTVCTSTQPISIPDWSTVAIIGTVCATGQTQAKFPTSQYNTNPAQIRAGTSGGQGLKAGCVTPPGTQPTYDRTAHIAKMTTTAAGNAINYDCSQWQNPNGFVRTWPANLKLTGNVSNSSSCDLTISGDVYITGNLDIGGAAKIKVANSVGTTRPVVLVDGSITVAGSAQLIANSSGTGIQFISFKSNATCGSTCTTLSGTALKTSQSLTTVDVGGAANLAGMIFQSYWGTVKVGGSGVLGAAVGQTVDLSGAGTITFGTKLSSGAKTWTITSYQQVYD